MLQIKRFLRCLSVVALSLISFQISLAQIEKLELTRIREQLALDYLKPAPHLALARYYWSKGDRLQAFYISENARRERFPTEIFDSAFQTAFGAATFQSGANGGGATWLEQSNQSAAKAPEADKRAGAIFNKAAQLQNIGKLAEAEELFVEAARTAPDSVYIQSWTGRFFYKVKARQRARVALLPECLFSRSARLRNGVCRIAHPQN